MIWISYTSAVCAISAVWLLLRAVTAIRSGRVVWKREAQLLLAYICVIVVARFTFFPFSKVDGQIQPLLFDAALAFPPRINLLPFVYMTDYPTAGEIVLNFVGNFAMFIPVGVIWPAVYRELRTHGRAIAAGIGFSLCIELLQLPFYDRVTDIDDLILNTLGYLAGYGILLLVRRRCAK